MTELIRFELFYNGNVHNGGLVSSHDDTGLPMHDYQAYKNAVRRFNVELDVPPYYLIGENNRAFFTPEGYANFKDVIERLIDGIHTYCHGWEVREIRMADAPECFIQYEDAYQKIIDLRYYAEVLAEEEYA